MFNIFSKISNHQAKGITFAASILSVFSLVSFILGILRDRLITGAFGAGNDLDIYYAAFRIPDFVAMVLMTGAISVAIIPIFTHNLVKSKEHALDYISNFLNLALAGLVIVCGILFIFTPQLMHFIVPGFSKEKMDAVVQLTRIMFLSPILLGISNIISAVLRVFQKFLITSLAPIVYNLGSIIGVIFFVPKMGLPGLAWGIVLGAFLHLAIQIPAFFKSGFTLKKVFNWKEPDFIQTIKLTIPRAIGLAASQINLLVVTIIGSTLLAGSVGIFSLANDLAQPIIGLVAIPFAVAVFPALALAYSKGDRKDLVEKFSSVFRQVLFMIVPLSAISFILRAHLVRIAFGTGKFDWSATKLTAACFGVFMFGIFAQGLIYLLAQSFYSLRNTKVPAIVSIISIASTAVFSLFFIWAMSFANFFSTGLLYFLKIDGMQNSAVIALPLAISLDAIMQVFLLIYFFKRMVNDFRSKEIFSSLIRVLSATFFATIFTYFIRQFLGGYLGGATFWVMFFQTAAAAGLGFAVFLLMAYIFGSAEVLHLKNFVLSQIGFPNGKSKNVV
jgi:putative peptidoglycan lipid II flippase